MSQATYEQEAIQPAGIQVGKEAPTKTLRILFATDGSPEAHAAQDVLAALPLCPGSAIEVVTVLDNRTAVDLPGLYAETSEAWAERTAANAMAALERRGVDVTARIRRGPRAYEIIEAATDFGAELLVIGAQHLNAVEAFFLGSISSNVAKHARCSVLLARAPQFGLHQAVLAVDQSLHGSQAAALAAKLPLFSKSELSIVHVVQPYHPIPVLYGPEQVSFAEFAEDITRQRRREGEQLTLRVASELEAAGKKVRPVMVEGDPATEIRRVVEESKADLLVLGARGLSIIQGLVVGSVADRLLKSVHCSILLTR